MDWSSLRALGSGTPFPARQAAKTASSSLPSSSLSLEEEDEEELFEEEEEMAVPALGRCMALAAVLAAIGMEGTACAFGLGAATPAPDCF